MNELELWSIREGSPGEIEESAQLLLESLREEDKRAEVFVDGQRIVHHSDEGTQDASQEESRPMKQGTFWPE